jgi:hypothetical protein
MSHSPLEILEQALTDVGAWSWWTGDASTSIQLEFSGVQLWFPPLDSNKPPSGQVALRFVSPTSVLFFSYSNDRTFLNDSWPTQFQADELGPFSLGYDQFTMTDKELASSIVRDATHRIQYFGVAPDETDFVSENAWIAFRAGPVGCVVVADELKIASHHGQVALHEIEGISQRWWEYWRQYWSRKDSDNPLPRDYACEVTIPLGPD